jgi:uncharacterized protein (TIGR02444 family)
MSFWDWALAAYARPGTAQTCLELQNDHGQSIPFLLWVAWIALDGRQLAPEALARGAALSQAWEAAAVGPLRQARQALKASMAEVDDAAREALREQVKAVELNAERTLMNTLEKLAARGGVIGPPAPALLAAAQAWGRPAPSELLLGHAAKLV